MSNANRWCDFAGKEDIGMGNVEGIFKAAQENPTVDSLLKTMETIVEAYKKLERENERLRRQLNIVNVTNINN